MGSIHIYTKKHKLLQTILDLSMHHTNYWKKEYKVDKIVVKEIKNRNPHIRVNVNR